MPLMLGLRLLVKTVSAKPSAFKRQMLSILWRDSADPAARILSSGCTTSEETAPDRIPGLNPGSSVSSGLNRTGVGTSLAAAEVPTRTLPSGWTASAVTDAAPGLKASGVATFTVNIATVLVVLPKAVLTTTS